MNRSSSASFLLVQASHHWMILETPWCTSHTLEITGEEDRKVIGDAESKQSKAPFKKCRGRRSDQFSDCGACEEFISFICSLNKQ